MSSLLLNFDETGLSQDNQKTSTYTLALGDMHVIVPTFGAFYWDNNLSLVHRGSPVRTLVKDTDYKPWVTSSVLTSELSKPVVEALVVTDTALAGDFELTAQFVGGYKGMQYTVGKRLTDTIASFLNSTSGRPITWDMIDHPARFPPTENHDVPMQNLTELQVLNRKIAGLEEALRGSQSIGHKGNELESKQTLILQALANFRDDLTRLGSVGPHGFSPQRLVTMEQTLAALSIQVSQMVAQPVNAQNEINRLEGIQGSYYEGVKAVMDTVDDASTLVPNMS